MVGARDLRQVLVKRPVKKVVSTGENEHSGVKSQGAESQFVW